MNWEKYRTSDDSIDLIAAYIDQDEHNLPWSQSGENFLEKIQSLQSIKSRQVSALCLVLAAGLATMEGYPDEHN